MFGGLTFGAVPAGASAEAAKAPRQEEKTTVVPTTIRGIEAAACAAGHGGEVKLFGSLEPSHIVVVAMVEAVVSQTASLELTISDGTGRIKARYYLSGEAPASFSKVQVGRYLTVVGGIRTEPELHLGVLALRAVETLDEVSYHLVECAHQALRARRGPAASALASPTKSRVAALDRGTPNSPPKDDSQEMVPAEVGSEVLHAAVQKLMESDACGKGEVGATVVELLALLRAEAATAATTETQLLGHLQAQVLEGQLMTTLDDDHYAAV